MPLYLQVYTQPPSEATSLRPSDRRIRPPISAHMLARDAA